MSSNQHGAADEVLFLLPARITRPFFSSFHAACEERFVVLFQDKLRPVLAYVYRDDVEFITIHVYNQLQQQFRWSDRIRLLVVVPTECPNLCQSIANISQEKRIPVIAATLQFPDASCFSDELLGKPSFVGCDNKFGAAKLGEFAARQLTHKRLESAGLVLVTGPPSRSDSRDRTESFVDGLKRGGIAVGEPLAEIDCNWKREVARTKFANEVERISRPIDIVFAANDQMALGVNDAVDQLWRSELYQFVENCNIYGFDGIDETIAAINREDSRIQGTVVQPVDKMADALVHLIRERLESPGEAAAVDMVVKPSLYPVDPRQPPRRPSIAKPKLSHGRWIKMDGIAPGEKVRVLNLKKSKQVTIAKGTLHDYFRRRARETGSDNDGKWGITHTSNLLYRIDPEGLLFWFQGAEPDEER